MHGFIFEILKKVFLVDEIKFGREEESLGMAVNCYKRH